MTVKRVNIAMDEDIINKAKKLAIDKDVYMSDIINTIVKDHIDDYIGGNNKELKYKSVKNTLSIEVPEYTMKKLKELLSNHNKSRCCNISIVDYLIYLINDSHRIYINNLKNLREITDTNGKRIDKDIKIYIDNKCSLLKHNMRYLQHTIDNIENAIDCQNTRNKELIDNIIKLAKESITKYNKAIEEFRNTSITKE